MVWAAFLFVGLFFVGRSLWFAYHKSPGFSVSKMKASITPRKEWEVPRPEGAQEEELREIFKQKFYFLSAGYQSYAFISEDERTIIKFFRMKRLSHASTDALFHPKKVETHKKNLSLIFNPYNLAYDEFKEDSGLIYIHLNKTDFLNAMLSITDQSGREALVDLDGLHFVIQEKAESLFPYLHKFIEKKDKEGFDRAVAALLALIQRRHEKGIADEDKGIAENYGFIEDRPIQFDIGRIYKGKIEGEYEEILRRLHWWMQLNPI
ncbi:MAG TPA: hypothetical protein VLF61_01800 [Rhabdochlamydiaceae bacterium]|nr:hypothetical protein [Rhabdochlamydiaceae bacterium]